MSRNCDVSIFRSLMRLDAGNLQDGIVTSTNISMDFSVILSLATKSIENITVMCWLQLLCNNAIAAVDYRWKIFDVKFCKNRFGSQQVRCFVIGIVIKDFEACIESIVVLISISSGFLLFTLLETFRVCHMLKEIL